MAMEWSMWQIPDWSGLRARRLHRWQTATPSRSFRRLWKSGPSIIGSIKIRNTTASTRAWPGARQTPSVKQQAEHWQCRRMRRKTAPSLISLTMVITSITGWEAIKQERSGSGTTEKPSMPTVSGAAASRITMKRMKITFACILTMIPGMIFPIRTRASCWSSRRQNPWMTRP